MKCASAKTKTISGTCSKQHSLCTCSVCHLRLFLLGVCRDCTLGLSSHVYCTYCVYVAKTNSVLSKLLPSVFFINITNLIQPWEDSLHRTCHWQKGSRQSQREQGKRSSSLLLFIPSLPFSPIKHFIWKVTGENERGGNAFCFPIWISLSHICYNIFAFLNKYPSHKQIRNGYLCLPKLR